jgi:hypothetical protein
MIASMASADSSAIVLELMISPRSQLPGPGRVGSLSQPGTTKISKASIPPGILYFLFFIPSSSSAVPAMPSLYGKMLFNVPLVKGFRGDVLNL